MHGFNEKRFQRRVGLLVALLVVVVAGPLVHDNGAQQASRYSLTAAVVDRGTVRLDAYEDVLGVDRVDWNGHVYSDKAPGQPLLATAPYKIFRLAGGQAAEDGPVEGNYGIWWLTLWTATVPGAALAILMYRYALLVNRRFALPATLGIAFGTTLLPFTGLLFGHVMAAFFGFAAFFVLESKEVSHYHLLAGGFLASAAVLVEYPALMIAVALGGLAVFRYGPRSAFFALGAIPGATFLLWYNETAFGDPLILSYSISSFGGAVDAPRAVPTLFSRLDLGRLVDLLFDPRGLVIATPIVLVAISGLFLLFWRPGWRESVTVAGIIVFCFLALVAFWGTPWAGESPGPRYLTPALPFLVAPLTAAWQRWPRLSFYSAGLGIATMALALATEPLVPRLEAVGLGGWMRRALGGDFGTTLFTIWSPATGWLLHLGISVFVTWSLHRTWVGGRQHGMNTAS